MHRLLPNTKIIAFAICVYALDDQTGLRKFVLPCVTIQHESLQ